MKKVILSICFVLLLSFTPVRAEIIQIGLTGLVDSVDDPYNLLENEVHQGDSISGFYIYDSTTPDTNPSPIYGHYLYNGEPYGILLTINNVTFQTNPANGSTLINITNDEYGTTDHYGISSQNNQQLSNGVHVESIFWQLYDFSGTSLSSDALPLAPLDLSKWQFEELSINGGIGGTPPCYEKTFGITANVTSVYLIPEPTTILLLVTGRLLLNRKRFKKR
jgi:hypothetical protein